MTSESLPASTKPRRNLLIPALLGLILLLGAFLRFYHLGAAGVGNEYYAAAAKSMLQSWHNFFFVAFEPGGSVSVDKPPLGFWVQALSAYFFGVSGFALALPNAIAGVLSIFVLYKLVRRPFGPWAGLAASLALALTPVAISAERNNTIDGLLVFVLLLAAWAFIQAVYTRKVRWLLLGAVLVGLGFNIKMLQAFLPLPAFYALYFFGAKQKWWQKLLHLAAATVLLLVISFSWAVVVDLVPANSRPYVDSTQHNTVMELIFGHNGLERLTNLGRGAGLPMNMPDGRYAPQENNAPGGNFPQPPGNTPGGNPPQSPGPGQTPGNMPGDGSSGGQPGGSMDFGTAGTLRLFTEPLVGEVSWLLPFVLGGLVILGIALWKKPFGDQHAAVILWAGWLLPEAVYFTYSQGLMHAYYLIMMGAPIAALAAATLWACWQLIRERKWLGWGLLFLLAAGTLVFQAFTLRGQTSAAPWAIGAAAILLGLGLACMVIPQRRVRVGPLALGLVLAALLVAPGVWSVLTTFNPSPNVALPAAGPSSQTTQAGRGFGAQMTGQDTGLNQTLLDYLLANTEPGTYLLATDRANDAAPFILATGRPVLTFGGFLGQYEEVSVEEFTQLVTSGQLRFVLSSGLSQHQEIAAWVKQNCTTTRVPGRLQLRTGAPGQQGGGGILYDCGK